MERVVGTEFSDNGEHPTKPKRHCCNMCDARHSKRGICGHSPQALVPVPVLPSPALWGVAHTSFWVETLLD